jgi:hypothetical protein
LCQGPAHGLRMGFPQLRAALDVCKKKGEILSLCKHACHSALTAIPVLTDNMCQLAAQASGTLWEDAKKMGQLCGFEISA